MRGPESYNPDKRKIYLALAQRMVDKHITENKLASEQEVFLYLHILKLQSKFTEALEFLKGEVCQKLYPGAPVYMKIDLMKQLQLWPEINELFKNLLNEEWVYCGFYNKSILINSTFSHDRWDYYQDYLSSCFEIFESNGMPNEKGNEPKSDNKSLTILQECCDFLKQANI